MNRLIVLCCFFFLSNGLIGQTSNYVFEVYDSLTKAPVINAAIHITDTVTKREILVYTDSSGIAKVGLSKGFDYQCFVSASDYYDGPTVQLIVGSSGNTFQFPLMKFSFSHGGEYFPTSTGVYFKKGSTVFVAPEEIAELDSFIFYVNKYGVKHKLRFVIEVKGHTRASGDFREDYDLGLRRADIIKNYIDQRLLGRNLVLAISLASSQPIYDEKKRKLIEEEKQLNDRVTVFLNLSHVTFGK